MSQESVERSAFLEDDNTNEVNDAENDQFVVTGGDGETEIIQPEDTELETGETVSEEEIPEEIEAELASSTHLGIGKEPDEPETVAAAAARRTRSQVLNEKRQREAERYRANIERESFLVNWKALENAMERRRIVYATVVAVEELNAENTAKSEEGNAVMVSGILETGYKVMIPFGELFRENPIDMSTVDTTTTDGVRDYVRRQRQLAEKLYGTKMPIIVKHMFKGKSGYTTDYIISASRRDAMKIIERNNFSPRGGAEPLISEGSWVEADVVSTSQYSLLLNIGGIDTRVYVRDMTYRYVIDMNEYYKVGEKVTVEVLKISTESGEIELMVSGKNVELEQAKARHHLLSEGMSLMGVVTSIRNSKKFRDKIVIMAYLEEFKVPVIVTAISPSRHGRIPHSGDEMRFTITGFTEVGFVLASCRGFHGSAGYLSR